MFDQPRSQTHIETEALLPLPAVVERTGLSRSTIYGLVRKAAFPAPRQIGAQRVAWLASELAAWMRARPPATLVTKRRVTAIPPTNP